MCGMSGTAGQTHGISVYALRTATTCCLAVAQRCTRLKLLANELRAQLLFFLIAAFKLSQKFLWNAFSTNMGAHLLREQKGQGSKDLP